MGKTALSASVLVSFAAASWHQAGIAPTLSPPSPNDSAWNLDLTLARVKY